MSHGNPMPGRGMATPKSSASAAGSRYVTPRGRQATPPNSSRSVRATTPLNSTFASGSSVMQAQRRNAGPSPFPPTAGSTPMRLGSGTPMTSKHGGIGPSLDIDDYDDDTPVDMEGYVRPAYAVAFDDFLQARKEFRAKALEEAQLKYVAERDRVLNPNLVNAAQEKLETLNLTLGSFYSSPVFQQVVKAKLEREAAEAELKPKPQPEGIPCPLGARAYMVEAIKSLGQINEVLKGKPLQGVEPDDFSTALEQCSLAVDKKFEEAEALLEKTGKSADENKNLLVKLSKVQEKREKVKMEKIEKARKLHGMQKMQNKKTTAQK